jgi:hypothetical protein
MSEDVKSNNSLHNACATNKEVLTESQEKRRRDSIEMFILRPQTLQEDNTLPPKKKPLNLQHADSFKN